MLEESHIFPRIKPRFYSLANNSSVNGYKEMKIVFSKDAFTTNGTQKFGHCTSFLSDEANIGSKVKCNFSTLYRVLSLPSDQSAHLLLIAQGTGVAPFISMLEQISENS